MTDANTTEEEAVENNVDQNEDTLESAENAFDFYDQQEEEERIGAADYTEDEDDASSQGGEKETDANQKLAGKLEEMEALLRPYGGVEGAARALEIVKTSPEYQAVTERLLNGKQMSKEEKDEIIDDPDLDPQLKKAYQIIDKRVEKLLGKSMSKLETSITDKHLKPLSDSFRQTKLETIEGQMAGKYGKELYKSVEKDMDKVLSEQPAGYLDNPSLKKIDDVFHTALRRSGKDVKFYQDQSQKRIQGKKDKSTGKPGTSGNASEELKLRTVKSIDDALYNAELKAKSGATNRENAKSRVSKKFQGGRA